MADFYNIIDFGEQERNRPSGLACRHLDLFGEGFPVLFNCPSLSFIQVSSCQTTSHQGSEENAEDQSRTVGWTDGSGRAHDFELGDREWKLHGDDYAESGTGAGVCGEARAMKRGSGSSPHLPRRGGDAWSVRETKATEV